MEEQIEKNDDQMKTQILNDSEVESEPVDSSTSTAKIATQKPLKNTKNNLKRPIKSTSDYKKLTHYAKTKILKQMQEIGINHIDSETLLGNFKCNPNDIKEFINNQAKSSESNVHYECDSPSFRSINKWLEFFREKQLPNVTANEPAFIMKLFSCLDKHPDPNEADGIDFKHLYSFLSNVMTGAPAIELNEPTQLFLCEVFSELIDDVNNADGDAAVLELGKKLKNTIYPVIDIESLKLSQEKSFQLSLDPLHINNITQ